jgi:hypothetical protein
VIAAIAIAVTVLDQRPVREAAAAQELGVEEPAYAEAA